MKVSSFYLFFTAAVVSHASVNLETVPNSVAIEARAGVKDALKDFFKDVASFLNGNGKSTQEVIFNNSTTIDTSLEAITLFEYETGASTKGKAGEAEVSSKVSIICRKCYLKGVVLAKLTIDRSANISAAINAIEGQFSATAQSLKDYAIAMVKANNGTNIRNLHFEPLNINLNIAVPELPSCQLELNFKDTEIYVELGLKLSAGLSYGINIYSSKQLGVQVSEKLFVGVVFSMDLLLNVDTAMEIVSGFHIRLDKDVLMKIGLFAKQASHLTFNGGKFEFLPVTVETAGGIVTAVLRLQIRTGFSFEVLKVPNVSIGPAKFANVSISTGVEARAYANVAKFITNVTSHKDTADLGCKLRVVQGYELALGAAAGASLGLQNHTWGPTPATEVPIYYTTMKELCITRKSTPTPIPTAIAQRALFGLGDSKSGDIIGTTLLEQTYTATACASAGMINCPASLQSVREVVVTKTVVTTKSATTVAIPTSNNIVSTVAFGKNAVIMGSTTGAPSSYVPTTTSRSGENGGDNNGPIFGTLNESSQPNTKLIVGLSVGLGVPALLAVAIATILCCRKKKVKGSNAPPTTEVTKDNTSS